MNGSQVVSVVLVFTVGIFDAPLNQACFAIGNVGPGSLHSSIAGVLNGLLNLMMSWLVPLRVSNTRSLFRCLSLSSFDN